MNFEILLNIYLHGLVPAGVLAGIIWGYMNGKKYIGDSTVTLLALLILVILWPIWLLSIIYSMVSKK